MTWLTSRGVMMPFFTWVRIIVKKYFWFQIWFQTELLHLFLLLCLQSIFESELKSHPETYYLYCFHTLWCFVYASGFLFMPLISYMYMPEQTLPMNFPEQDNFPMDIFFFVTVVRCSVARLPDGNIWSLPFLGLRQGGWRGGAIQGKEGIKFCSLA